MTRRKRRQPLTPGTTATAVKNIKRRKERQALTPGTTAKAV